MKTSPLYGLTETDKRRVSEVLRWSEREINRKPIHRRRSGLMGGGTSFKLAVVISNSTGGGYYNCAPQWLDASEWDSDNNPFFDTENPIVILNIVESGTSGHILVAGNLVYFWRKVDDEGEVRYVGQRAHIQPSWSALDDGLGGLNDHVFALCYDGNYLYAGGIFTTADGVSARRIACWDGSSWSALDDGIDGLSTGVYALSNDTNFIYAGGNFATASGVVVNDIARWDGSSWSALGDGIDAGTVKSLHYNGTYLYVGGDLTGYAGGIPFQNIARWDGNSWSALGGGYEVYMPVEALCSDSTYIYLGGILEWISTNGDGFYANNIARWNGSSYSPLGEGTNGRIHALCHDGTYLYAGGYFSMAGGVTANYVARWDGSGWSALGSGMNNHVIALHHDGTCLYAGGRFTMAGGVTANRVARWNGSSWSALGDGIPHRFVQALHRDDNYLYAGGNFNKAGGAAGNYIARWGPL